MKYPKLYSGCLVALSALASLGCRATAPREPEFSAEIRRTSFGIPHVLARDEAGIGYGIGYAYAQDNLCQFADVVVTVNSQRSRYFGPDVLGGPDFESGFSKATNAESDFLLSWVNSEEHVRQAWQAQSATSKALIRGYAAGFNRYLKDTPAQKLPAACRDKPWLRPLTELDLIRFMRRLAVEAGSALFSKSIIAARPPGTASAASTASLDKELSLPDFTPYFGSNAVALGKQGTQDGKPLLLGNPHYPWYGSLRFYQMHLTIPGKLDVMGVSIGGIPAVTIGFNQHVAWTHTVNTSAHFVIYALQLDPNDPTHYLVDGKRHAMERKTVSIATLESDGKVGRRSHDFWMTQYGPVLTSPGDLAWNRTTAYALHDANFDNHRMIETWYAMNRAGSLDELTGALQSHLGIPWVNTLGVDSKGEALYANVTVVPNLSAQQQQDCITEPHRALTKRRMFVLESKAACALGDAPGAPQKGVFSGDQLPVLRRADFVQNSNDSSWMTNPEQPLTGYAPIISAQDLQLGDRTRQGIGQVQARLAGTDGLPGKRFTAETLQAVAFSNRSFYGSLLDRDLSAICENARSVVLDGRDTDVAVPCATIKSWDRHANLDSVGYPLAGAWIDQLIRRSDLWSVPFSANDPVNTPRGIKQNEPRVREIVLVELARAAAKLREQGIDATRPWGELQGIEANGRRIPIPGGVGSGIYNNIWSEVRDGRFHVRGGSSYIQMVTFDEKGPKVQGLLAYSQSTDPSSPHFADQAPYFSANKLVSQPFTTEQIKLDPNYTTTVIEE
ncbi:acylase [Steroidobacter sp.]|uniref:acylase n=1 Tax=Steroidobacter sp. TaxID=1978227 RepID=UPI001A3BCDF7|nr:acylase [Steroidobacter sp.]MBL8268600.1 acylase [Steroidobacter sp.]